MFGLFELFQIGHFRHAQHLDLVMVDKIQMPHKGECGAVGFYADTVVAAGRTRRPRHLQLALVVLIKAAYRNTGHELPFGLIIDEQVARGGGILRAQKRIAHGFVGKAFGQVRQNFQMFAGR